MRAHLFVSALFAASLFGGAALADRPGEDGGRTTRMPVQEMRVREAREPMQRDVRPHQAPDLRVRDPQIVDRFRSRGDMVDRTTTRASAPQTRAANDAGAAAKAQRDAAKAQRRLEEKKNAVINCAPNDEACAPSARAARAAAEAGQKAQKAESDKQRAEIQKMVERVRAEKMKEKMNQKICERMGNLCAERL